MIHLCRRTRRVHKRERRSTLPVWHWSPVCAARCVPLVAGVWRWSTVSGLVVGVCYWSPVSGLVAGVCRQVCAAGRRCLALVAVSVGGAMSLCVQLQRQYVARVTMKLLYFTLYLVLIDRSISQLIGGLIELFRGGGVLRRQSAGL